MRIVIDEYGAYIRKKSNRFLVSSKDNEKEYSCDKVSQFLVLRNSAISSEAIELAMEKNIDIVFFDRRGKPYARVYPCRLGGTTLTRRNQLNAYFSMKGVALAKSFIKAKIENMGNFLISLGKSRKNKDLIGEGKKILHYSDKIESVKGEIDIVRNILMGIEGESSKIYFSGLQKVLPPQLYSGGRTKRPPQDIFNAFLSYGYGILYSEVERACIISGLDPYLGFLHTDRHGRTSFVLDLIEEFRQVIVDRAIITLGVRGQLSKGDVDRVEKGVFLNGKGRKKAIKAIMQRFETKIKYKGKNLCLQDVILAQARGVAKFLNSRSRKYRYFVHRW